MAGETFTSVKDFYKDKSIFITGATGFMGKVLVEKLLRSCPDIKNIYLLMRPKRDQNIQERLQELLNGPLFETLRRDSPGELTKIIPVAGDIAEPQLGISVEDQNLLIRSVSIIFHSAATVKLDEALKLAVTINTLGTKKLVQLCNRMHNVEAFIHLSTAYCNCDRTEDIAEEIYPVRPEPDLAIALTEGMDDKMLEELTPILIASRPNTYTFTKALAERMLQQERGSLPVAIVRPSIVLSSYKEPIAGWAENYNGPTGIIAAAAKGFLRTMLCHEDKVADLVPVDIVISLMICAAWRTATQRTDTIPIYNCCTGLQNPITWKQFVDLSFKYCRKHPMDNVLWYPDGRCHSSTVTNKLCATFQHTIPAYILDTLARLKGSRPIMVRLQTKLSKAAKCSEFFRTKQWNFRDDNVRQLREQLSPEDRKTFMFDVRQIDWSSYLEHYILGIRQFILRESPDTLPAARSRMTRLYWVHKAVQLVGLIIMLCVLFSLLYFVLRICGFIV